MRVDGSVTCWGEDNADQASPPDGLIVTDLFVGFSESCGLMPDASLQCWGRDPAGIPVPTDPGPNLTVTKTDALLVDVDRDGEVNPGDELRYTVVIANSGSAALGMTLSDIPDLYSGLLPGTVTTSQGTVNVGNGADDDHVQVDVGTLASGATVTITFDVMVDNPVPLGVTQISNQGVVSGSNFDDCLTDDPEVGGDEDPTVTPVVLGPLHQIATLDQETWELGTILDAYFVWALRWQLASARTKLDGGQVAAAIDDLEVFVQGIAYLMDMGMLPSHEGDPLIDAANTLIGMLET